MRSIIVAAATVTVTLFSSPAFAQQPNQGAASIPDFSGMWFHPYVPGFEPPANGPGPVLNKKRRRQIFDIDGQRLRADAPLVSDLNSLVGDYDNPILKPGAAEIVKKHGEAELNGGAPNPLTQCWPGGVPFVISLIGIGILQQPDTTVILYGTDVRHVLMNQPPGGAIAESW